MKIIFAPVKKCTRFSTFSVIPRNSNGYSPLFEIHRSKLTPKSILKISESRGEFLEKLQRARGQVKADVASQPILSSPSTVSLLVGNWSFACQKENELAIYNSDGQQTTVLCEDLPGFEFESNRGTRHRFAADSSLGPEFASGWSGKPGKKFVSKAEALKLKVKTTAREVQEKYFQTALSSPREVVTKLQEIVRNLYTCCDAHESCLDVSLFEKYLNNHIER